ncbi:MAG: type II toxin-antitoxin system HicB family antitoxin [Acidimicrobiia bacterium]|nr:type II toxin-antitoxin system HicB family antitoxin [Acidimicrobiia bacterium]MCY4434983.1 type II toxin-antitoxin system HicB family antitoxin [bacterium]
MSDTHRLTVGRSGKWWAIKADSLPGCHSQARRRAKIESTARDAIALWFDADEDEVGPLVVTFAEPD